MIFIELFTTFFVIGLFTVGGGYAMLSLIQTQVVTEHGWLTEEAFTDIVAVSQMTPGPIGINCATYVGYDVLASSGASQIVSVLGSFTATSAVVLPSFLIVLAICRLWTRFSGNTMMKNIMGGLKPAVTGLIGAAAIMLMTRDNFPDYKSWIIFALTLAVSLTAKPNPIICIVAGGIIGFLIY